MGREYIVVTGAIGFIGTNLVETLNKYHRVNLILVDHLSPQKRANLKLLTYTKYYDKKNFLKLIRSNTLPYKISHIIHLGACTDTTVKDKDYLLKNNTEYSKFVFKYCVENGISLIYASSAATYGNGEHGYSEYVKNLHPNNYYGLSKYLFDIWVLKQKKFPPQWIGLKFFNVYGPHEGHKGKMASMIYQSYLQIKSDKILRLFRSYKKEYEDGGQKRDFIYVKDIVDVISFFIKKDSPSGIYNLGTGEARTFIDMGNIIFRLMKIRPKIKFIKMPENIRGFYQYFTQADIRKLRSIGYNKKFYSLEEGVKEYILNHL